MAEFLPSFPQFDPNPASGDVGSRCWRKWVARFRNLMIAIDLSEDERHKAMLYFIMLAKRSWAPMKRSVLLLRMMGRNKLKCYLRTHITLCSQNKHGI